MEMLFLPFVYVLYIALVVVVKEKMNLTKEA